MNDLHGAERDYRRALELGPDDVLTYLALGSLLASQDRTAEARSVWQEGLARTLGMLESEPRSDRLHSFAIRLHAALGDRAAVEREEQWSETSSRGIHELPLFTARALLGDHDEAIDLGFAALARGRLWVGEALDCNAAPGSAVSRLSKDPRYAALVAELRRVQQELLARFPID
jgi:tetratricopeptide (TPR) repeat protein